MGSIEYLIPILYKYDQANDINWVDIFPCVKYLLFNFNQLLRLFNINKQGDTAVKTGIT